MTTVVYGQERVLVTWKRMIFPNGASLSLKDGMPETDATRAAGFHDQVNQHLVRVFGNALLLSVFSAGVQLSQVREFGRGFAGPSAGNVLRGRRWGQELGQTGNELIRRGINIAPTLEIRPGYTFNVMVTQDLVFPGPYEEAGRPGSRSRTYPAAELKGRVPGDLYRALEAYATYYWETTKQAIEVWALVVLRLQQFVDTDWEFQAWRRAQNGPGGGPVTR